MTLDEAIIHAEEVASIKKEESIDAELQGCDRYSMKCEKCSTEHRQLAEWLKELKVIHEIIDDMKDYEEIFVGYLRKKIMEIKK